VASVASSARIASVISNSINVKPAGLASCVAVPTPHEFLVKFISINARCYGGLPKR